MAKQKPAENPPKSPVTFEASLARLEEIAACLEEGQLGLGESLACYEEGVKHLARCYELLDQAERKIELLAGVDADGNEITEPFDEEAQPFEEKAALRGRRRSVPTEPARNSAEPPNDDIDERDLLF